MELLHLLELPNICNIFAIIKRTGIDNQKDFCENKLKPEVLKSFLEEIMGSVLSQEGNGCKSNTQCYISFL